MSATKVMLRVSELVSFIKEKTSENIVEFYRTEDLDISEEDVKKLVRVIESSVTEAYTLAGDQVEKAILSETTN
tara:strand:- start:459 stop:680 length:222 start_codon:yes stop_codon:yes gene_type:complete